MSSAEDEAYQDKLREFNIELELLIATMIPDVPQAAIKRFYGSDDMAQIVAKAMAPVRRHVRR